MIWLAWKLTTLPIRLAWLGLRIALGTVRILGVGRIAAFGAGVAAGRALSRGAAAPAGGGPAPAGAAAPTDLAAAVRHELATAPRTWHLPQPSVSVQGDRVTLAGTVPDDQARLDLVRTVGAMAGVRAVDDHLTVEAAAGTEPGPS